MTTRQMAQAIGKHVGLKIESLIIPVEITDIKEAWGRLRFEVTPLQGSGSQWVEIGRLSRQPGPGYDGAELLGA
jgi:hypothetical protein